MSDYFKAIDKNGVEREFALDLKQYALFVDPELCPRIQEIRKIINPTNEITNVLMNQRENHYLEDDTPFYYYKKSSCGDGFYCIKHPKNRNKKMSLYYLPLVSPSEITDLKMYWEDEVDQVIREPGYKQFEIEIGTSILYTKDGKYTEAYINQFKKSRQIEKNLSHH